MNSAERIREAVARVVSLRNEAQCCGPLQGAFTAVKSLQSRRFSGTYRDLLQSPEYGNAARFFLIELYSEKDYSLRDAQFAKIAGALQRLLPKQVVGTAVALAELHVLTEELDFAMAKAWLSLATGINSDATSYINAWHIVGRTSERAQQLDLVLQIGTELSRLTRTPGLRMMLRMMRRPACAGGLTELQSFLESGFDTFSDIAGEGGSVTDFLTTIRERETKLMEILFDNSTDVGVRTLAAHLSEATPK